MRMIIIILLGVVMATVLVQSAAALDLNFEIDEENNVATYNSSKAFIQTPYQIIEPGTYRFLATSKTSDQVMNVFFLLNTSVVTPKNPLTWDIEEINITNSLSCNEPYWYNYTTEPARAWCWYNNTNATPKERLVPIWNHTWESFNLDLRTIYYSELVNATVGRSVGGSFNKITNFSYQDKNTAYVASNVLFVANKTKNFTVEFDFPILTVAKYDWGFYPATYPATKQGFLQAQADGKAELIDPFINDSQFEIGNVTNTSNYWDVNMNTALSTVQLSPNKKSFWFGQGNFSGLAEDDFNRSDGALGTATNGNSWSSTCSWHISNQSGFSNSSSQCDAEIIVTDTSDVKFNITFYNFAPAGADVNRFQLRDGATERFQVSEESDTLKYYNGGAWVSCGGYTPTDGVEEQWHLTNFTTTDFDLYIDDVFKCRVNDVASGTWDRLWFRDHAEPEGVRIRCITSNSSEPCYDLDPAKNLYVSNEVPASLNLTNYTASWEFTENNGEIDVNVSCGTTTTTAVNDTLVSCGTNDDSLYFNISLTANTAAGSYDEYTDQDFNIDSCSATSCTSDINVNDTTAGVTLAKNAETTATLNDTATGAENFTNMILAFRWQNIVNLDGNTHLEFRNSGGTQLGTCDWLIAQTDDNSDQYWQTTGVESCHTFTKAVLDDMTIWIKNEDAGAGRNLAVRYLDLLFDYTVTVAGADDPSPVMQNLSINFGTIAAEGGGDTCTYGGSGDHTYLCSDNCVLSSDTDHAGNTVYISGTGSFTGVGYLTNTPRIIIYGGCHATT